MKLLVRIGLIVIALLVVAVVIIGIRLDSMIKSAVKTIGPRITRTTVKLDGVRLSVLSGRGRIRGLVIGNPEGFKTENAFKLADTRVHLDVKSVLTDRVVVDEIVIDGPEVTYERGGSGTNIDKIQKNVESFSQDKPSHQEKKAGPQKKFLINRLLVKNGRIRLNTEYTAGKTTEMPLPDIELKDIGKNSNGATMKEVSSQVISAIGADVVGAVASVGKNVVQGIGKAGGNVGGTAKEVGGQAGKAASGAIKNGRGIFGK